MNRFLSLITNCFLPAQDPENEQNEVEEEKVIRELRDLPPLHYLFEIQNFSQLSNAKTAYFESTDFEVGGYKWRLRLHLFGNGKWQLLENEKGHISLYLLLSESNGCTMHQQVNVYFKLFIYNQILDKYLTVQDAKGSVRRFRGTKIEWGFDEMLLVNVFNDASNGYLINDSCIFGAEVFVLDSETRKGVCASLVKELGNNTYTWIIENFQNLKGECYTSEVFVIGGHNWRLRFYPNGRALHKGKSLSAYLYLEDSESSLNPGDKLNVEFVLHVRDQLHGKHHQISASNDYFSASTKFWGFLEFIPLSKLNDTSKGYIINGAVVIEVQIYLLTVVKDFS